jgi:hypothetical protein
MPPEARGSPIDLRVQIERSAADAYGFLCVPQNFAKWASGLGSSLRKVDGEWIAQTAEGPVCVRFSEPNSFGVLDHSVIRQDGTGVYVPLRVLPRGDGCELVLTLLRQPGVSDEKFAADADWVMRDLQAAKRLLEQLHR